jgi:hypothetical protein
MGALMLNSHIRLLNIKVQIWMVLVVPYRCTV